MNDRHPCDVKRAGLPAAGLPAAGLPAAEMSLPQFHTIDQVAASLAVKPSTVKRWLREGRLRATRRGRNWVRISEQAVAGFLSRETVPAPPAPAAFTDSQAARVFCHHD